jgi:MFS family permease
MAATLASRATAPNVAAVEPRRWLALVCIAVAQLMIALDATVVNIAMPTAQAALRFSDADRQWLVTAYTLTFGVLLLPGGRVADSARLGRRRAFLIGLVAFAAASALTGAALNLQMLVVARALQGACAALLAPTALSLLAVLFTEPRDRARAFGIYGAIAASGGAIGLLLGGALTQYLDWRWCLYVNVPIALLAALGARAVLAEPARPDAPLRTHHPAVADPRRPNAPLRTNQPRLLSVLVRVIVDRQRGPAYLSALLAIAGMFGAFLFLTYVLQVGLGLTPLQAGVAFLPMSAATFVAATLVVPRIRAPRVLMVSGFLLAALGMAVLSQVRLETAYATGILPAEILLGLGIACVMVPSASLATSGVTFSDAGIASAALNATQQLGASFGTGLLNSVAAPAVWGALLFVIGALVALSISPRKALP